VRFRIDDRLIQLAGETLPDQPEKIEGIPVNREVGRLCFLHGTQYGGGFGLADGTVIGQYRVRFEDKTAATITIVYGEDVRDWWSFEDPKPVSRGKVAWVGSNPVAREYHTAIRLYLTIWENPYPRKRVISIDYVSTRTSVAAPFCVAVTAEGPAVLPPDQEESRERS